MKISDFMKIVFDRYPKPTTVHSEISNVVSTVKSVKQVVSSVVTSNLYSPSRKTLIESKFREVFNNKQGVKEIRPYFDPLQIGKFYDSVTGDRPIICYNSNGFFITTFENLFDIYSRTYSVQDEDGYEVIYPDDLFTLTVGHRIDFTKGFYDVVKGLTNKLGFNASLARVKRIIRHKVSKRLVRMRSTLGESTTTEDHSYILVNGNLATPYALKEYTPAKLRRASFKLESNISIQHSPNCDIEVRDGKIYVYTSSASDFARFVRYMYELGEYHEDNGRRYYKIPVNVFIVALLGDYNYKIEDDMIILYDDEPYFDELYEIFGNLKSIKNYLFDDFLFTLILAFCFNSKGYWETSNRLMAAYISFALSFLWIDYVIKYEDGKYIFIDSRNIGMPYLHSNIELEDVTSDYSEGGASYVYDLSVEGTEVFADGVGLILLHNTEVLVRRAVDYYVTRMPMESWTIVSDDPEVKEFVLRYFEILKKLGTDIFGELVEVCVRQLLLYANCFILRKYSNKKYNDNKIVIGYEVIPLDTVSILFDTDKGRIVGYNISGEVYKPDDVIHIYINRHPGFLFGTPNLYAALNDIKVLRILEQNLEILSATYSRPPLAIKVGTAQSPASRPPNDPALLSKFTAVTDKDLQKVRDQIKQDEPLGMFILPWYHDLVGVNVTPPMDLVPAIMLFKTRIYQAMGVDPIVMGETVTRNRDTAEIAEMITNRNVSYIMRKVLKAIEDEIVNKDILSLLPFEARAYVYSDRLDMREYQQRINLGIMLWNAGLLSIDEFRRDYLGLDPLDSDGYEKTIFGLTGKLIEPASAMSNEAESRVAPENQYGKQLSQPRVNRR